MSKDLEKNSIKEDEFLKKLFGFVNSHASELRQGSFPVTLTPWSLAVLHRRRRVFAVLGKEKTHQKKDVQMDNFEHTLKLLHSLKHLRIEVPEGEMMGRRRTEEKFEAKEDEEEYDLSLFPSLIILECNHINPDLLKGVSTFRPKIQQLVVNDSIRSLQELLLGCFGDRSTSETAWKDLKIFACRENGFSHLDNSLKLVSQVEFMDLSRNKINKIEHLQDCYNLRHLDLSFNRISSLIGANRVIGNLTTLILRNNKITSVEGLGKLYSLEKLDLSNNHLVSMSEGKELAKLPNLKSLSFQGNPVSLLPKYRFHMIIHFEEQVAGIEDGFFLDTLCVTRAEKAKAAKLRKELESQPIVQTPVFQSFIPPEQDDPRVWRKGKKVLYKKTKKKQAVTIEDTTNNNGGDDDEDSRNKTDGVLFNPNSVSASSTTASPSPPSPSKLSSTPSSLSSESILSTTPTSFSSTPLEISPRRSPTTRHTLSYRTGAVFPVVPQKASPTKKEKENLGAVSPAPSSTTSGTEVSVGITPLTPSTVPKEEENPKKEDEEDVELLKRFGAEDFHNKFKQIQKEGGSNWLTVIQHDIKSEKESDKEDEKTKSKTKSKKHDEPEVGSMPIHRTESSQGFEILENIFECRTERLNYTPSKELFLSANCQTGVLEECDIRSGKPLVKEVSHVLDKIILDVNNSLLNISARRLRTAQQKEQDKTTGRQPIFDTFQYFISEMSNLHQMSRFIKQKLIVAKVGGKNVTLPDTCSECEEKKEVVGHCEECKQWLCRDCDMHIHAKGARKTHTRNYRMKIAVSALPPIPPTKPVVESTGVDTSKRRSSISSSTSTSSTISNSSSLPAESSSSTTSIPTLSRPPSSSISSSSGISQSVSSTTTSTIASASTSSSSPSSMSIVADTLIVNDSLIPTTTPKTSPKASANRSRAESFGKDTSGSRSRSNSNNITNDLSVPINPLTKSHSMDSTTGSSSTPRSRANSRDAIPKSRSRDSSLSSTTSTIPTTPTPITPLTTTPTTRSRDSSLSQKDSSTLPLITSTTTSDISTLKSEISTLKSSLSLSPTNTSAAFSSFSSSSSSLVSNASPSTSSSTSSSVVIPQSASFKQQPAYLTKTEEDAEKEEDRARTISSRVALSRTVSRKDVIVMDKTLPKPTKTIDLQDDGQSSMSMGLAEALAAATGGGGGEKNQEKLGMQIISDYFQKDPVKDFYHQLLTGEIMPDYIFHADVAVAKQPCRGEVVADGAQPSTGISITDHFASPTSPTTSTGGSSGSGRRNSLDSGKSPHKGSTQTRSSSKSVVPESQPKKKGLFRSFTSRGKKLIPQQHDDDDGAQTAGTFSDSYAGPMINTQRDYFGSSTSAFPTSATFNIFSLALTSMTKRKFPLTSASSPIIPPTLSPLKSKWTELPKETTSVLITTMHFLLLKNIESAEEKERRKVRERRRLMRLHGEDEGELGSERGEEGVLDSGVLEVDNSSGVNNDKKKVPLETLCMHRMDDLIKIVTGLSGLFFKVEFRDGSQHVVLTRDKYLTKSFIENISRIARVPVSNDDSRILSHVNKEILHGQKDSGQLLLYAQVFRPPDPAVQPYPPLFGSTLEDVMFRERASGEFPSSYENIPRILDELLQALKRAGTGHRTEGIFRVSSRLSDRQELKTKLESDYTIKSEDPHNIAGVLKMWLRSLSEPIIPFNLYMAAIAIGKEAEYHKDVVGTKVDELLNVLPNLSRSVLFRILELIRQVAAEEKFNKMNVHNMAVVLSPCVVRPPGTKDLGADVAGGGAMTMMNDTKYAIRCLEYFVHHSKLKDLEAVTYPDNLPPPEDFKLPLHGPALSLIITEQWLFLCEEDVLDDAPVIAPNEKQLVKKEQQDDIMKALQAQGFKVNERSDKEKKEKKRRFEVLATERKDDVALVTETEAMFELEFGRATPSNQGKQWRFIAPNRLMLELINTQLPLRKRT